MSRPLLTDLSRALSATPTNRLELLRRSSNNISISLSSARTERSVF